MAARRLLTAFTVMLLAACQPNAGPSGSPASPPPAATHAPATIVVGCTINPDGTPQFCRIIHADDARKAHAVMEWLTGRNAPHYARAATESPGPIYHEWRITFHPPTP